MKNRYKYSLIFHTGVDMTHACIRIFDRHRLWRGSFSTRAGPGLDPLVTPIIYHLPTSRAYRGKRLTTRGGDDRVFVLWVIPQPHHGRASQPSNPLRPRFPL